MTENSFCHNHPNAKAIAPCHRCALELCGMCGNYFDDLVLCERCAEIYENEKFVSSQSEKLERPKSTLVVDSDETDEFTPPGRSKKVNKLVPAAVIGLCGCVIAVQLYLYSNPGPVERDPAAVARELAVASLVDCLLVFREIGLTLQDGRMPDESQVCADSPQPNVIRNEDGVPRIWHPNPRYYGYEEISVSATEPEPRVVQLAP